MKKRVMCDVDDTIADTQLMLIDHINETHGADYKFHEMDRDYREDLTERTEKWQRAVWATLKRPDIMVTAKPSEGALEAMQLLVEHDYSPDIVTARKKILFEATAEWLRTHGFADHVYTTHPRLDGESGVEFKVRIAKEVGFQAAFDDTLEVVLALAKVVPQVYLINKPWNLGYDVPENVTRVDSFAEGVRDFLGSQ